MYEKDQTYGELEVEPAKCGFNQDTSYYCPVWKGDPVYQEFYEKVF